MGAPICHIPPPEQPPNSTAPSLPSIPLATDLKSALMALNAIRQILNTITSSSKPLVTNNVTTKNPDKNGSTWVEISRVNETVKVTNPNDDSQYVEVQRINKLVMQDQKTGQKWTWNR